MSERKWKIVTRRKRWIQPNKDHTSDQLKIRLLLEEKIIGNRIICLEVRIEPGEIHQLHLHQSEFVIVYSTKGTCRVIVGTSRKKFFQKL